MNQERTKGLIIKLYKDVYEAQKAFEEGLAAIGFDEASQDYMKVYKSQMKIHWPSVTVWYTTPNNPEKFMGLNNLIGLECVRLENISGNVVNILVDRLTRSLKYKYLEKMVQDLKSGYQPYQPKLI
jgi:hypothetical protein